MRFLVDFGFMFHWRRNSEGSTEVLEGRISALEAEIRLLKAEKGEIVEWIERLDRITKRAFRLREQMERLEADPKKEPIRELTRADLLKRM